MHTLSTLFPAAFPALALSHFVALLSPGPDFFLLVGYAVRYRIRGSIGLCLGIAAGNALYIVLAIVGWGLLRQAPLLCSSNCWGRAIYCGLAACGYAAVPRRWRWRAFAQRVRGSAGSCCWGWGHRCSTPKTPCFIWR